MSAIAASAAPMTRCAADYQTRISGPLIDRIDLHIEVPAVTAADLLLPPPTEGSREVGERVAQARARQVARYAAIGLPHVRSNAAVPATVLEDVARPDPSGLALLREAADAMRLSARGYHRVLAGRPHAGRSRRRRQGRPRPFGGGAVLSGADRRNPARGLEHISLRLNQRCSRFICFRMSFSENRLPLFRDML